MKDVEKTNVNRQNSRKRMRRRKRNMNIYGLVVLLLVITAGITISYTFLFNINEIRVSGESDMYTAEQIVEASGISEGDNLLRLDPKKAQQQILDKLWENYELSHSAAQEQRIELESVAKASRRP